MVVVLLDGAPELWNLLEDWNDRLDIAESMVPLIGRLYRKNGIVTRVFGRPLVNSSPIEILKHHKFARRRIEAQRRPTMTHATTTLTTLTIGIDLGDRFSHFCVLDSNGEVVEEGRLRTTQDAFRQRFVGIAAARIALEAGTHSPWVSELLKQARHDVLVANPGKLRMIYKSG